MTCDEDKAAIDAILDELELAADLEDVARRLRELKGIEPLSLREGSSAGIMFGHGICSSPVPRFGAECQVRGRETVGLPDVADALDRIRRNLGGVDVPTLVQDLRDLLRAFRAGPAIDA